MAPRWATSSSGSRRSGAPIAKRRYSESDLRDAVLPAMSTVSADSAAALIARFLKARGVDRVFALCGGHIMPIWMRADAEGIRIVQRRLADRGPRSVPDLRPRRGHAP